uniref:Matrix metalloproteinase-14 n=2 Tax=Lygus hesperus TaxID=30085 RepID=A0A0A9Z365_LYGHE
MCFFSYSNRQPSMLFILLRICLLAVLVRPSLQNDALVYLSEYGYLPASTRNPTSEHLMDEETYMNALKEFQAFAGLNITGQLDDETKATMRLPRCGVKDKVGYATSSRSRRYALQGSRWRVKNLTYKIAKYPKALLKSDTDLEIKKAFEVWSGVTPLTFTQKKSGPVHIEVRFETGEHGDGDPFDGRGGTLAHAFFPVYGGDAHFDDAEKWSVNSYHGTNLFQVAAHEFGHSLGLSHSDIRSALMAPFYRGYQSSFELDEDDVEAIQALYGQKPYKDPSGGGKKTTTEAPVEPGDEEDAELCNDATVDTLFSSADGVTYAFKGLHYWKLTEESIAPGYPRLISRSWPGLPGNIDAAFTYKNGKTYFFKGTQYWRYTGKKVDGNYPKKISEGFAGIPDNIDAAMVWGGNGKIYFYKGSKFWRFDPTQKPPVKSTYPKDIANWEGIPNNLDAALQYTNGYAYFFKKGQYYRFNDRTFSVDVADPPFPRPAGYWWFGCKSETAGGMTTGEHQEDGTDGGRPWPSERRHSSYRDDDIDDIIMDGGEFEEKSAIHR